MANHRHLITLETIWSHVLTWKRSLQHWFDHPDQYPKPINLTVTWSVDAAHKAEFKLRVPDRPDDLQQRIDTMKSVQDRVDRIRIAMSDTIRSGQI